jgi:hypothetical protein
VKWFLRIIGLIAILVVAGLLAWQWMNSAQQRAMKDLVKTFIHDKPRPVGGPLQAGADVTTIVDGGLVTGDEPPFALAAGPWSMVQYESEGHLIRPNLHFDFEPREGADTTKFSRSWSHGGGSSYRMAPGEDYSPAVRRHVGDVATSMASVEVGFWMWSASPRTLLTAVVSFDRGGKQLAWFGKDLPADTGAIRGSRLNCKFLMRELSLKPTDIVSVYLWKRGGKEAFIDDMDIFFHSTVVPGRMEGTALPLDSVGLGGRAPMGYATVALKEVPVDTTRFMVGGPAMSTTEAAVPIGGTDKQWRFVPQEGVAYLIAADGTPTSMLRPWSPTSRVDITHFERVVAETRPQGVLLTGFDVDFKGGKAHIASSPPPKAVILEIAPR